MSGFLNAQAVKDSAQEVPEGAAADDPSKFFTRLELFNEIQRHANDFSVNMTVLRANVKLGKRFTSRVDIPFVYNSTNAPADISQSGLGDISFRLLGYKILESKKSALTASLEVSLNTANSKLLGTGKNILVPMLTYTRLLNSGRYIFAMVLQQSNSIGGDSARKEVSYTKLQPILLHAWSKKMWTTVAPELYIDYIDNAVSMNLEGRMAFAPAPRFNTWVQLGAGIFGDFIARYQWGVELGCRYFFMRTSPLRIKDNLK